ncbi:MAG TPA: hypothetical protein ENH41_00710 [Candidatus Omnitrophica bacterium]|nr:hypothetical protein [Candidatus Omnitrophota bacterium]
MEQSKPMVFSPSEKKIKLLLVFPGAAVLHLLIAIILPATFSLFIVYTVPALILLWFILGAYPKRLILREDGLVIDKFIRRTKQKILYSNIKNIDAGEEDVPTVSGSTTRCILYVTLKDSDKTIRFDFGTDETHNTFLSKFREHLKAQPNT